MQINRAEALEDLSTIGDFLRWTVSCVEKSNVYLGHGTDNSQDEALALVLPSLHLPLDLNANLFLTRLTRSEREYLVTQVQKRIEGRIPTPYLTNKAWFGGFEFYVDERVLIPRSPFAEFLQDMLPNWFGAEEPSSILELCTGSACIGILAAMIYPHARVMASDISADALEVAKINLERYHSEMEHPLRLIQSDLFEQIPPGRFDLIISNPPYVGAAEMATLPPEYHQEPALALASGMGGLEIVIRILAKAEQYLNDEGVLVVEVGNSDITLQERFSNVPFLWLDFERGGHGVFVITAEQLREYKDCFKV